MPQEIDLPYPPMPAVANGNVVKPSPAFQKQVIRSVFAIILFIATYLFVLAAVIAITITFCYIGYSILTFNLSFLIIVAGAGLILCGLTLVYFVIKFLFKIKPVDYSGLLEITETEQPRLFEFINRLTVEAGAPKPGKIYISPDVNAGVFYNSSFWSMFLPVKKNLKIGLGLVNILNVAEFKAVMAHEFGHFAQRSMKFGSYFYNFNKVAFDMLYENSGYNKLLNGWARGHALLGLIAHLNIYIVKGIQGILMLVYKIINKTYMALSREMEFHADAVGAYVAGSNQMISALKKIEFAQYGYSNLLDFWTAKLEENKRAVNFYTQHASVLEYFANKHNIALADSGLPVITQPLEFNNEGSLKIDSQWSSHPSLNDREQYLNGLNLNTPAIEEPAWVLFDEPERLQIAVTDMIYNQVKLKPKYELVDLPDFRNLYNESKKTHLFNEIYKDFYDTRNLTVFDTEQAWSAAEENNFDFSDLFSDDNVRLPLKLKSLENDQILISQILDKKNGIRTFEYKGLKYTNADAANIKLEINADSETVVKKLAKLDSNIFLYFSKKAGSAQPLLAKKYKLLFECQADTEKDLVLYTSMMNALSPLYTKLTPLKINRALAIVYDLEGKIKSRLKTITTSGNPVKYISEDQLNDMVHYISEDWIYYFNPSYNQPAITAIQKAMDAFITYIQRKEFVLKEDLLNFQLSL